MCAIINDVIKLYSLSLCSQTLTDQAKKNKSLAAQLKEINGLYEEEQRVRDEQHEMATRSEKRANDLQLEIEELRTHIEQVGRREILCRNAWTIIYIHMYSPMKFCSVLITPHWKLKFAPFCSRCLRTETFLLGIQTYMLAGAYIIIYTCTIVKTPPL